MKIKSFLLMLVTFVFSQTLILAQQKIDVSQIKNFTNEVISVVNSNPPPYALTNGGFSVNGIAVSNRTSLTTITNGGFTVNDEIITNGSSITIVTTESDPVFATNGVKKADTNGWVVTSHDSFLTNNGFQINNQLITNGTSINVLATNGSALYLTNFPVNLVQTNFPKYLNALTNESDTLPTVIARTTVSNRNIIGWGNPDYGQTIIPAAATNAIAVASGERHTLALLTDRTVIAWGDNFYGQRNVPASATNVIAIASMSSAHHSLALRANGSIVAWGFNGNGQTNVPASITNAVAVGVGEAHSLAVLADGTVIAWGENNQGETNVPVSVTNAIAVAGGHDYSLALLSNGTIISWGVTASGVTNVPTSITNAIGISAAFGHAAAVLSNGSVVAWGINSNGQTNAPASITNAIAVSCLSQNVAALLADGSVVVWGATIYGQTNVPSTVTDGIDIAGGAGSVLAVVYHTNINISVSGTITAGKGFYGSSSGMSGYPSGAVANNSDGIAGAGGVTGGVLSAQSGVTVTNGLLYIGTNDIVTVETDPVFATNGVKIADTNSWVVSSHDNFLTNNGFQINNEFVTNGTSINIVTTETDPVFATNGVTKAETNGWVVSNHNTFLTNNGPRVLGTLLTNGVAVDFQISVWSNPAIPLVESDPVFDTNGVKKADTNGWIISSHSAFMTNRGFSINNYFVTNGASIALTAGDVSAVSNTAVGLSLAGGLTNNSFSINNVAVGQGSNVVVATTQDINFAAAPFCYQITLTNTSPLSFTNNWSPTQSISRIVATSTGTVTFVMNWPATQVAYWGFCYDATGRPSTVFPAGAIYFTSGVFSNTAPTLGQSNYVSVMHSCASYQIMAFTNSVGTWGTP